MKFAQSLVVLIIAIIASTNAATTYSNFNVTNSATDKCKTLASTLSVNKCTSACDSVINIKSTSGSTNVFNFGTFAVTDTQCAATAVKSTPFTCVDSKSIVPIADTTYSVICIADPEPTEKPDSSSANTLISTTSAILFTALLSALAL